MADARFEREVRKELLRARAAVERVELVSQWRTLRHATSVRGLIGEFGPAVLSRAVDSHPVSMAWSLWRRYPMIGSALTVLGSAAGTRRSRLWRRLLPLGVAAWVGWQVWSARNHPDRDLSSAQRHDDDTDEN